MWLLLPASETPDAYADTFATRLRLLGVRAETVDRVDLARGGVTVDIADRLSRSPNRFASVLETGQFPLTTDEVVIDAGAADGDSLRKFLEYQPDFAAWHAFEPDPAFAALLAATVAASGQGKALAVGRPLAEVSGPVHIRHLPGTGNTFVLAGQAAESRDAEAVSIDDYLANGPVPAVSIIKMDVEGYEPALLRGARRAITAHRPKLLISAYHEVEHMFEIPDLIRSMRPDYTLSLRNHTWAKPSDSWPGSFFCETVIYAY